MLESMISNPTPTRCGRRALLASVCFQHVMAADVLCTWIDCPCSVVSQPFVSACVVTCSALHGPAPPLLQGGGFGHSHCGPGGRRCHHALRWVAWQAGAQLAALGASSPLTLAVPVARTHLPWHSSCWPCHAVSQLIFLLNRRDGIRQVPLQEPGHDDDGGAPHRAVHAAVPGALCCAVLCCAALCCAAMCCDVLYWCCAVLWSVLCACCGSRQSMPFRCARHSDNNGACNRPS